MDDELSDFDDPGFDDRFTQPSIPNFDFNDDFGDAPDFPVNPYDQAMPESSGSNQLSSLPLGSAQRQKAERNVMRMVASTASSHESMFQYFDVVPGRNWAGAEFWKRRALKSKS